jgi:hypothetical protein
MDRPDRSLPPVSSPDFPYTRTHLPAWWVDAAQRWTAPRAVSALQADVLFCAAVAQSAAPEPPRKWRPKVGERVVSLVDRTATGGSIGAGRAGVLDEDDGSETPFRVDFGRWVVWCREDEIGEAPAS